MRYARCDMADPSKHHEISGSVYLWQHEGKASAHNMLSMKVLVSGLETGWHGFHIEESKTIGDNTCAAAIRNGIFKEQDLSKGQRAQLQGL